MTDQERTMPYELFTAELELTNTLQHESDAAIQTKAVVRPQDGDAVGGASARIAVV